MTGLTAEPRTRGARITDRNGHTWVRGTTRWSCEAKIGTRYFDRAIRRPVTITQVGRLPWHALVSMYGPLTLTYDPNLDPNTWPESQQRVLRMVAKEGGWYTSWEAAPSTAAMRAVERRTGVAFQREHGLHEAPWYEPHREDDKRTLLALAERLTP